MNDILFKIVDRIGTIKVNGNGWTKELNIVSWNKGQAKYDIREWDPSHERMTRGITLTEDEMATVVALYREHHDGCNATNTPAGKNAYPY